tara:strand:- start:12313 stop:13461 length:1149 start_codon:yes stop_codon:yes gene_type:complete
MAHYFLFPETDTTLYSHPDRSEMNAGGDEILEIVKERGSTDNILYPTRILIKFKNEDIEDVISNKIKTAGYSASLQLTAAEPKNLVSTLNLELFALSQSFDEGTGRYSNLPTSSNGASWKFRNNTTVATEWTTSSFGVATTGSIDPTIGVTLGGGVWYTGSEFRSSQQFLVGQSLDTDINVKHIIDKFSASLFANQTYPDGISNNGFLIKKPDVIENNTSHSFGELQYFSTDTHTIHPPKLVFKWDDSTFIDAATGSAKQSGELNVSLYRNQEEYNQNDEATFRIHVRDKYPTRTFSTTSNYLNVGYFTTSSFYSVRDAHSEREIIPFDENYTKLSADDDGMFFKLYMKGLQPERYYRILFKHTNNDGTTIYDDKYFFKVVR